MIERRQLSQEEIDEALATLDGWQVEGGKIRRQFKFSTFGQALGWMVAVGLEADKLDHHPDWSNSYNKVDVSLKTHDLDALTPLDIELARRMEALFRD